MQQTPNLPLHDPARLLNSMSANLRSSGIKLASLLKKSIIMPQQMRRPRLKIDNGKKLRPDRQKAENGSLDSLDRFMVDQVDLKRARKAWTGS